MRSTVPGKVIGYPACVAQTVCAPERAAPAPDAAVAALQITLKQNPEEACYKGCDSAAGTISEHQLTSSSRIKCEQFSSSECPLIADVYAAQRAEISRRISNHNVSRRADIVLFPPRCR
jgi:hypothetical protein